ncbi:MAG: CoA transferase [Alphaproteobacteria bacterium]|nr:CoA transferase [Alphaproteobacteria bacterium]
MTDPRLVLDDADRVRPLAGVRVIEFCQVAAGPFCGLLLADMGADVIKIEPPAGDSMRAWPPVNDGYSENFAAVNRNKRSVVLDLKRPSDRDAARRLILAADVVIENNRPGVMDRLGLGYAAMAAEKPALVYASISAYGQSGPAAGMGGFDVTVQAVAGVMSVTGEDGGAPVKAGVPVSDFAAGLYAAYAVVAVLHRVRAGHPGAHIDLSMLGASLAIAALQTSEYFGTGEDPRRLGSAHPRNAPYQAFRARDGHFVLAAGNDKLWSSVCAVIAEPALVDDPRFRTTADRARNQAALVAILEAIFAAADASTWLARFQAAGVPSAPINRYSEALADPQVAHMGWVEPITLPGGRRTRTFASPVMISGARAPIYRRPPALGEHTREVLDEIAGHGTAAHNEEPDGTP